MPIAIEVRSNMLPGMGGRMLARVAEVVAEAAIDCQSLAKTFVPKDTGTLARSIGAEPENAEQTVWVVGTNVEYAPYVEFGTVHMAAQPYMTPASEQVRPRFISRLENVVKDVT